MGKRTGTETVVEVMLAFLAQRTWTQASLARHVGIGGDALKRTLQEMTASGIPLERQEELPQVYWSVPRQWFPGGIVLRADDALEVIRLLARSPGTARRDEVMSRVLEAARGKAAETGAGVVVSSRATEAEESFLPVVEDAASKRTVLLMRYYTASRGSVERRRVSIHRVVPTTPARFVGTCHRDHSMKWFRVDNIMWARLDSEEQYEGADGAAVDGFVAESLDGFHQGVEARELRFWVKDPEARWVARNLLEGMSSEPVKDGISVVVRTSAPLRVARYVVGLGGAVTVESEQLRVMVRELARAALAGSR